MSTVAKKLKEKVKVASEDEFEQLALDIFHWQREENKVYKSFIKHLGWKHNTIHSPEQIPYLPISFYKNHKITSTKQHEVLLFESSGTTGGNTSKNYITDPNWYLANAVYIFQNRFGSLQNYLIYALLPGYLDKSNSSLVYMMDHFIKRAKTGSGFFLGDFDKLKELIKLNKNRKKLLFGVTHALLDMAEKHPVALGNGIVMDTGGMKGRKKEIVREELTTLLKAGFHTQKIYSEYGMTELCSQLYADTDGILEDNNRIHACLRDPEDPLDKGEHIQRGGVNIIDLANIDTCCFIETQDLGERVGTKGIRILGRFDHSDIRGCNLLYF